MRGDALPDGENWLLADGAGRLARGNDLPRLDGVNDMDAARAQVAGKIFRLAADASSPKGRH